MKSLAARLRARAEMTLLVVALVLLAAGGVLHLAGAPEAADALWALDTVVGVVPACWWVIDAARHRRLGVDALAVLALVGTLTIGEYLAGAVITVMLASGRTLEARAAGRARRELRALLARAPRVVHRYEAGELTGPSIDEVVRGDLLLVQPGEVVPVDGLVDSEAAVLDESALTGEPLPITRATGDAVRSGVVNAGGPFDLRATTSAAESTYAGIVRLVSEAEASSAPFVRLADRYAGLFLGVALAIAAVAWAVSGDPERAVAVLVVATPCPLILAAPVAIVSGLSRAARRGVVVKGGGALEQLAGGEILLFDKTGTITSGHPRLVDILTAAEMPAEEVLRFAASLDQVSPHVLAAAVVRAARARGLTLSLPRDVEEVPGHGVRGFVEGRPAAVGKASWTHAGRRSSWARSVRRRAELDGALTIFVEVDGGPAGALLLDDPIRPDAARTIRQLRRDGIRRIVMVTGDREENAQTVGAVIGVDDVLADRTPADKVEAVRLEARAGRTIMVGDGINDAPALALADVGVAVGARGATASSEAADVVLTVDRLDRLGEAVVIARRSRRIAMQSVVVGVGLSLGAMVVAAFGYLPPVWGAIFQEVIDVAVIVNALRALRDTTSAARLSEQEAALAQRFGAEHTLLRPDLARLRDVADKLDIARPAASIGDVREVHRFLVEELDPHEQAEDHDLYPALARVLGGNDPTATMSRAHVEISHLIRRLGRVLDDIDPERPDADDITELRRLLYGLYAILQLHFAQEDEGYFSLVDEELPKMTIENPRTPRSSATRSRHRGVLTAGLRETSDEQEDEHDDQTEDHQPADGHHPPPPEGPGGATVASAESASWMPSDPVHGMSGAASWDERYRASGFVWSTEPNRFLPPAVERLTPGRALDLACGEGRNAVWLATQGWVATGVDFSATGLEKAVRLAEANGVVVEWVCGDVTTWRPVEPFDLVVVFYLQLPEPQRSAALGSGARALAPGGTLLVVAHDRANLTDGIGGPQDPSVLYTPDDVRGDLEGSGVSDLVIERAERVERPVETDAGTVMAIDCLVRARRATAGASSTGSDRG